MKMKIALKVHKVSRVVEVVTDDLDGEKNNMAIAFLLQSIPESLISQVGELDLAEKVWEAIRARHVGAERVREARLQTLMGEFDQLKMKDSKTIDDFMKKLSEISSKSISLGVNIEESKIVKKFLKCLPRRKYIHIVAYLEQVLNLNTTCFIDIVGRLKTYEEQIFEEEVHEGKLMYTNTETHMVQPNRDFNGDYRGRGCGRYGGRDLSQITCFRCDKTGHYASHCPDRLLKLQETQEGDNKDTHDADKLMMHEVVYLNEKCCVPSKFEINTIENNIRYLDNGASNHMTGDVQYFYKLDHSITGKVRFGDDSHTDIKGKWTIAFIDMNRKPRVMSNVYFIHDLKNNIISLGHAT